MYPDEDPSGQAWAKHKPSYGWLIFIAVCFVAAIVAGIIYLNRHNEALDRVVATAGRLTLENDKGEDLKRVDRRGLPDVWYRVTLEEVPRDTQLSLTCEWVAPDGRVVHTNRYQTNTIDKDIWPTHAHHRLSSESPTGTWTVRLLLKGRELHSKTFEVRDGPP